MVKKVSYTSTGVNYDALDLLKRLAQSSGRETTHQLKRTGAAEVPHSRGESAFVWEESGCYRAFVIEGLGTKNLIADTVRPFTGKTHYDTIAQDTVAMIVNDLLTVGADPQVITAYFAVGTSEWFYDTQRTTDLVEGWKKACLMAGATWGGGETPGMKGVIEPNTIDLAGSCIGIIKPKSRLASADRIRAGDAIILMESSGVHANGLSMARSIAERVPEGYAARIGDATYGEALLTPTFIYADAIRALYEKRIDIHYMANITGHGWRKLMRADSEFAYIIEQVPPPHPVFAFMQKHSGMSDEDMYATFNMGAGFALYVPEKHADTAVSVIRSQGLKAWNAGYVEAGPRQVVIKPKNIMFRKDSLQVR